MDNSSELLVSVLSGTQIFYNVPGTWSAYSPESLVLQELNLYNLTKTPSPTNMAASLLLCAQLKSIDWFQISGNCFL